MSDPGPGGQADATISVEVLAAWPRRHASVMLRLPAGATVAEAITAASAIGVGHEGGFDGAAVFGERAAMEAPLADGDRVELLRPLQADPKDARRRRANGAGVPGRGPGR